jgi:hypothetical protein
MRRGMMSSGCGRAVMAAAVAVVLVFVSVNQVLVRLWARAARNRSLDRRRVPSFGRVSDRDSLRKEGAPSGRMARVQRRCERVWRIGGSVMAQAMAGDRV